MPSKEQIKRSLQDNDLAAVTAIASRDRKALSQLVRIAYDKDTLVGWRAILAAGCAAREMVDRDEAFLRETCRKLLWSLTDESGGIGWSAPELLGEIVSAAAKRFEDIVPLIASVYDAEDVFRPGVLYALGRIAEQAPDLVAIHQKIIIQSLVDKSALVRCRGMILVSILWPWVNKNKTWSDMYVEKVRSALLSLKSDMGETWIYTGADFTSVTVSELANKAIILMC